MIDTNSPGCMYCTSVLGGIFFLPKREILFFFFLFDYRQLYEPKDCCYRERVISRKYIYGKKALLRYLLGGILFRLVAILLTSKSESESESEKKRFDA